jgi:hypothetical protein
MASDLLPENWTAVNEKTPQGLADRQPGGTDDEAVAIQRTADRVHSAPGFILTVAALGGCSAAEPEPDVDDIDWTLSCRLPPRRPKLDLQVKSWTQNAGTPEALHYH